MDPRKHTPRYIIMTLAKIKDKERILQAAREKETVTYKGVPIRLTADFSKETLQARRGWKEVFEVIKDKDLQPRVLYPAKLSFRMEGKIKCFSDKVKLKEIKNPQKELSNEEIANLSDANFKTLVIRMLTEMIELGHKIKEDMKAIQ